MTSSREDMEKIRKIFQIISHPTRIAILKMLENPRIPYGGTYYNAIKNKFAYYDYSISSSTLHFHLNKLIDIGSVTKSDESDYKITMYGRQILTFSKEFKEVIANFDDDKVKK